LTYNGKLKGEYYYIFFTILDVIRGQNLAMVKAAMSWFQRGRSFLIVVLRQCIANFVEKQTRALQSPTKFDILSLHFSTFLYA
jgi:hypothetical protein